MSAIPIGQVSWELLERAVQKVHDRMYRAVAALERAGVPYAVIGGNAVAAWVRTVDESAVRNTQDVDITIRRIDLDAARAALEGAGFLYRHVKGIDMFLDGRGAKARDAVHIIFAGEKVRADDLAPAPTLDESEVADRFRVLSLEALVRMKLTSFRLKDRVHLQDMHEVGLIDASWLGRFTPELSARLKTVFDNPDGQPEAP